MIARTDSAAPPRESASAFDRITPVSGSASLKARAVCAASWPLIASTTNSVSTGLTVACRSRISCIIAASMASRPAVSTISTSANWMRAVCSAPCAMSTGRWPSWLGTKPTPTLSARVSSWRIAAGR